MDTADKVLQCVRDSLLGITSPEIVAATGESINRVTAALKGLYDDKCVSRMKTGRVYSYYYTRPRPPRAKRVVSRAGAAGGLLVTIPVEHGKPVTLNVLQARKLYGELHKMFGEST